MTIDPMAPFRLPGSLKVKHHPTALGAALALFLALTLSLLADYSNAWQHEPASRLTNFNNMYQPCVIEVGGAITPAKPKTLPPSTSENTDFIHRQMKRHR